MGEEGTCEIEAEIGRIQVKNGNNIVAFHQPKERIHTQRYTALALHMGTRMSYREGVDTLNELLHRDERTCVKLRTFSDLCCREGEKVSAYMARKTEQILEDAHFDSRSGLPVSPDALTGALKEAAPPMRYGEVIEQARAVVNGKRAAPEEQVREDRTAVEDPNETCYVSIDEIGVTHQKEHRQDASKKQGAYVWNAVATVEAQGNAYTLTNVGMPQLFRFLLAYLLSNHLLEHKNLVFFTDGAKDIRSNIEALFSFHPYTIILDWYHLKKRCKEYLSMSLKGSKDKRNQILQKLLRILWAGNVTQAISYLRGIDAALLRPANRIEDLCRYFEKHRDHIPSYALRQELGLRVSSSRVEKANDLVVAQRQKKNGMSWSPIGSGALAQLKALSLNGETDRWLSTHSLAAFRYAA